MGIDKGEAKLIKDYGKPFYPCHLKMYKFSKVENLKWSLDKIYSISRSLDVGKLKKIKQYAGINKTINYLRKQEEMKQDNELHGFLTLGQVLRTWFDYIGDLKTINENLKKSGEQGIEIKENLFPIDLYKAHQDTISKIKYFENKKFDDDIKKLITKRNIYKFKYKGLVIRAAESSAEIIKEGEALHHCVGGYVRRHSTGETNILLLRKLEEEEKSFYTVEIKKGNVIQVHGLRNANPTKEIEEFMKVYKEKILSKINKKIA